MGILIGDTNIYENGGQHVEYSRTISVNYQSERVSIGFPCPKGMSMSDALFLAEQLVNAKLGLDVMNPKKVNLLCHEALGEPLDGFRKKKYGLRSLG